MASRRMFEELTTKSRVYHENHPGLFFGHALIAGGMWKGDVLVADDRGSAKPRTRQKSTPEDPLQEKN